jgi:hypothetical protein
MSHTKHSNTVFPGDRVKVIPTDKTATAEAGKVVTANPDSGKVKVAYPDGREDWVDLEKLEKLG